MSSLHFLKYSRTIWLMGLIYWVLVFGIFSVFFIMPAVNGYIFWANIIIFWIFCYVTYNLSRSEFVENPENNFKMKFADDTRYLLSEDKISKIYYQLKGLDEDKIHSAYHRLAAKYLIAEKILEGYEHENPANQAIYYLLNNDHSFYYDEEKDALLAFTTKKSAEFYIKNEMPDFNGYILPLNVMVDGKEVNDSNATIDK